MLLEKKGRNRYCRNRKDYVVLYGSNVVYLESCAKESGTVESTKMMLECRGTSRRLITNSKIQGTTVCHVCSLNDN